MKCFGGTLSKAILAAYCLPGGTGQDTHETRQELCISTVALATSRIFESRYPARMPLRGFGTNGFQGQKAWMRRARRQSQKACSHIVDFELPGSGRGDVYGGELGSTRPSRDGRVAEKTLAFQAMSKRGWGPLVLQQRVQPDRCKTR